MNAAGLGPARASALLSAAQALPFSNFHTNLETAKLFFFFPIKSSRDGCPVEAEHYLCKTISAVTAEFNGFTFPKQSVSTTGTAASPEVVGILLSVDINSSSLHSSQLKASVRMKEQLIKKGSSSQQSY